MAYYQEQARVHTQPPGPPHRPASGPAGSTKRIDCDTCPIAGRGCGDCMVALLGPVRFRLDGAEERVVEQLREHGLVTAAEAAGAYAVPEPPGPGGSSGSSGSGERLRAIG